MAGVLLLACGLLATVVGWRVVWFVRSLARRVTGRYTGPQVPMLVRRVAPWRLIPVVGEAVVVWNRRAKLAKLLALPLLLVGPLVTVLGGILLAHEAHGAQGLRGVLIAVVFVALVAALVWRCWKRGRRVLARHGLARQDQA